MSQAGHYVKPAFTVSGWNDFVRELHAEARRALKAWADAGTNRQGPLFENKKRANANFLYALRFLKTNENTLRSDSLAKKLQNNNLKEFWKEIKTINKCKTLPTNIDGVNDVKEMTKLWQEHYSELLTVSKVTPL